MQTVIWPSSSLAPKLTHWRLPSSGILRYTNSLNCFLCVLFHSIPLHSSKFIQAGNKPNKVPCLVFHSILNTAVRASSISTQNPLTLPISFTVESQIFAMVYEALHIGPLTTYPTTSSFLSSSHSSLSAIAEKCHTCPSSRATVSAVPSAGNVLIQMTAGLISSLRSGVCLKHKLSRSPVTLHYKIRHAFLLNHSLTPYLGFIFLCGTWHHWHPFMVPDTFIFLIISFSPAV